MGVVRRPCPAHLVLIDKGSSLVGGSNRISGEAEFFKKILFTYF